MVKELEKEFVGTESIDGFQFRQVESNDKGYVYEITHEYEDGGIGTHYEVFERRLSKPDENGDSRILYPVSRSFGYWAWTYRDKDMALRKLNSL